ncbi:MAG: hypothetical protein HFI48_10670 [Lachnospiraceae bacterium]|nr:hypothetical protein [Lachnospiraceae bacterium]
MKKTKQNSPIITIWKEYRPLCAAAGILTLIMYYFSKSNDADVLLWILTPTARWAGILSGISFTYLPHQGYVNHFHEFLIAPSCAGSRFMLLTFLMLTISFPVSDFLLSEGSLCDAAQTSLICSKNRIRKEYLWFGFCILFAYAATIFVNGIRIAVSIFLPVRLEKWLLMDNWLTPGKLHTLIGTISYFTFLCVIYLLASSIRRHLFALPDKTTSSLPLSCPFSFFTAYGRMLVPVFWYLLIVLAAPFIKRLFRREWEGFGQYAASVLCVCLAVCGIFTAVRQVKMKKPPQS